MPRIAIFKGYAYSLLTDQDATLAFATSIARQYSAVETNCSMTLPVRPYAPKVRVTFATKTDTIDVTDDDLLSANTQRSINSPAGQWDVLLTGARIGGRSFIDRIAPMDYVEIEMARTPSRQGELKTIFRGFVDNVREVISGGQRRIRVNGRDFRALLLIFEIYYMNEIDPVINPIPQARLSVNFGIPAGILSPTQFINLIGKNIVAPNLAVLQKQNPKIPVLSYIVQVPDRFAVNGFTVQPFTGSVINLLTQYASRPWIETFVEDGPSGPRFVYRFAPR